MKKFSALIYSVCFMVLLTGCNSKTDTHKENLDTSEETMNTDMNESSSEEEEEEVEQDLSSISGLVNYMINIDNLHTDTERQSKDSFKLMVNGTTFNINIENTDIAAINDVMLQGELTDSVKELDYKEEMYTNNGNTTRYTDYGTGKVEWVHRINGEKLGVSLNISAWEDSINNISFNTDFPEEYTNNTRVDGISTASTVQDVIDTYGIPDEASKQNDSANNSYVYYVWYLDDTQDTWISVEFLCDYGESGKAELTFKRLSFTK